MALTPPLCQLHRPRLGDIRLGAAKTEDSVSAAAASPAATSSIPRNASNVPETAPSSRAPPLAPRPSATGPAGCLQHSQPLQESVRQPNQAVSMCTQLVVGSGCFAGLAASFSRAMMSSSSSSACLRRKLSSARAVSHRPTLCTPRCIAHAKAVEARLRRNVRTCG
jgi:hypothetical protein